jgi:hypothetical protein
MTATTVLTIAKRYEISARLLYLPVNQAGQHEQDDRSKRARHPRPPLPRAAECYS